MRFLITLFALVFVTASLRAQPAEKPTPKKLPAEEMKKLVDEYFEKNDKNKDGYLTPDELPGFLGKALQKFDANGDGKLDRKEVGPLIALARGMAGPLGKGMDPASVVENMLKQMDTDNDGKISKAEAKGRMLDNFALIDTNKDGFIDRTELRAMAQRMLAQQKGPQAGPASNTDFDALDKNADGRLTPDELRGSPWAARFGEIDADTSGQIDRREFNAFLRQQQEKKSPTP